jgi:pimeloyl-ACP methyl ester carboxylesterase
VRSRRRARALLGLSMLIGLAALGCRGSVSSPRLVSVPTPDRGVVNADLSGDGTRGVVLVGHGGYSTRASASWKLASASLVNAGFRVLVIDTRAGDSLRAGKETACLYDAACMAVDVLSAVRYLRSTGATSVAVIAGSAGGGAAARAAVDAAPGEIERLVLLAPMAIDAPEKMKGRKLFITSRDDPGSDGKPRLPGILDQYEKAPEPKELVILEGSAHAQRILDTAQADRLMREILRFLEAR